MFCRVGCTGEETREGKERHQGFTMFCFLLSPSHVVVKNVVLPDIGPAEACLKLLLVAFDSTENLLDSLLDSHPGTLDDLHGKRGAGEREGQG
jgi:hypothetical protein